VHYTTGHLDHMLTCQPYCVPAAVFQTHHFPGTLLLGSFPTIPRPPLCDADLVLRLLTKDPTKRATTDQLLMHPWLVKHGVASEKPLDPLVITRMKTFARMNRLKKVWPHAPCKK
jgi:hypothetical protein